MTSRLSEIEARLKAATPGEWAWFNSSGRKKIDLTPDLDGYTHLDQEAMLFPPSLMFNGEPENRAADARLLAAAPDDLAWAVAEIRRLREGR